MGTFGVIAGHQKYSFDPGFGSFVFFLFAQRAVSRKPRLTHTWLQIISSLVTHGCLAGVPPPRSSLLPRGLVTLGFIIIFFFILFSGLRVTLLLHLTFFLFLSVFCLALFRLCGFSPSLPFLIYFVLFMFAFPSLCSKVRLFVVALPLF